MKSLGERRFARGAWRERAATRPAPRGRPRGRPRPRPLPGGRPGPSWGCRGTDSLGVGVLGALGALGALGSLVGDALGSLVDLRVSRRDVVRVRLLVLQKVVLVVADEIVAGGGGAVILRVVVQVREDVLGPVELRASLAAWETRRGWRRNGTDRRDRVLRRSRFSRGNVEGICARGGGVRGVRWRRLSCRERDGSICIPSEETPMKRRSVRGDRGGARGAPRGRRDARMIISRRGDRDARIPRGRTSTSAVGLQEGNLGWLRKPRDGEGGQPRALLRGD